MVDVSPPLVSRRASTTPAQALPLASPPQNITRGDSRRVYRAVLTCIRRFAGFRPPRDVESHDTLHVRCISSVIGSTGPQQPPTLWRAHSATAAVTGRRPRRPYPYLRVDRNCFLSLMLELARFSFRDQRRAKAPTSRHSRVYLLPIANPRASPSQSRDRPHSAPPDLVAILE